MPGLYSKGNLSSKNDIFNLIKESSILDSLFFCNSKDFLI